MKKLILLLTLIFCTSAFAQAQKNVAVLEIERRGVTVNEISREEAMEITDAIRNVAVRTLPRGQFNIMTSETVQAMGGAVLAECFDENCVIALGRTIDAEYVVRGSLSKFQTMFTLNVAMFETEYGNLVATSEPVRSENLMDILSISGFATTEMLENFLETSGMPTVAQTQPTVRAERELGERSPTDHYFAPKWMPIPILAGFNAEYGQVRGRGWWWSIDGGFAYGRDYDDGYTNQDAMLGGTFNTGFMHEFANNFQIAYGVSAGFWFARVEGNEKRGFGGPIARLRWQFIEVTYRGLFGNDDDPNTYISQHQLMIGLHFSTNRRRQQN